MLVLRLEEQLLKIFLNLRSNGGICHTLWFLTALTACVNFTWISGLQLVTVLHLRKRLSANLLINGL